MQLTEAYNSLLGIADANRALERLGGEETVGNILSAIADAGLADSIGVRLLHKHNDIVPGETMLETALTDDEGFALITSATSVDKAVGSAINSWRLTEQGYVPCEFSRPEVLADSRFRIQDHQTAFDYVATVLRSQKADLVLGPCLNYSEYVMSYRRQADAKFLEKTDVENRANVMRYISLDDPVFANSVKTKWQAGRIADDGGKMIWAASCSCFCSVFPEGGHQGTKTHRYSP